MRLVDRCLYDKDLNPDDIIDDEIYLWHGDHESKLDLNEHLGLSWNEWCAYVEQKLTLQQIVSFRREKL